MTGETFILVISQLYVLDLLYTAFMSSVDQKQTFDYQQKTAKSLLRNLQDINICFVVINYLL